MKKILMTVFGVFISLSLLIVTPAFAAKPADTCAYIKDGTIKDKFDNTIPLGYNNLGYNYEAHMFNGKYCDAYNNAEWCQQFKDVSLMMKWNDAWLSNKDCGTQNDQADYTNATTPDTVLDRHYPSASYLGSGAWLTNHATGTYTSSKWQLNGNYVLSFDYLGSTYVHDMTVTTATNGTFSGTGGYPSGGAYSQTWTVTGTIVGGNVSFNILYDGSSYYVDATGIINADGTFSSGLWNNASQSGTWTVTSGVAAKPECTVSDFVKIVAAPTGAIMDGAENWTVGGTVIGPAIWGNFAIIQEIASDPCGEYGVIDYMSPLRKGLGNW